VWIAKSAAIAGLLALAACTPAVFHCADDEQCELADRSGACMQGHCAFANDGCPSGWMFAELAPPELAGTCVGGEATTSGDGGSGSSSIPATDEGSSGAHAASSSSGSSSGSIGECPIGSPCEPGDPCALAGVCDEAGTCEPTTWVSCDDPPGPCYDQTGSCNDEGRCEYAVAEAGVACNDDDPCTVEGTCDGRGQCVPGETCPTDNPCEVGLCKDDGCVFDPVPNGSSCGNAASKRCCNGGCVDISSDVQHCGGCNTACAEGLACESVANTSSCDSSPAATSGRCRCQFSNAQCPNGQICRTFTPFPDRCTPPDETNCDGSLVPLATCPNYCAY
jgi:hypothetical protein